MISATRPGALKFEAVEIPTKVPFKKEESPEVVQQHLLGNPPENCDNGLPNEQPNSPNHHCQGQTRSTRESPADSSNEQLQGHPPVRKLHQKLRNKTNRIRRLEEELASTKNQLRNEQSALRSTRELLEEKTTELQAANSFLSQTDSFSCADVVNLAETLNYEIQQVSSQISNACGTFESVPLSRLEDPEGEAHRAQDRMGKLTGIDLRKTAQHPAIRNDPELRVAWIELMIQALLVKALCCEILNMNWSGNENLESALSTIYDRIIEGNSALRSIAGKWRTLTHAISQEPFSVEQLVADSLNATRHILVAFGATELPLEDEYRAMFHDDMEPVITNLIKLNTAIKQKISSIRIHPLIAEPDLQFESQWMVDSNSPDCPCDEESEDRVFASVSLGLYQATNAGEDERLLLKPKVVLETLLQSPKVDEEVEEIEKSLWNGGSRH